MTEALHMTPQPQHLYDQPKDYITRGGYQELDIMKGQFDTAKTLLDQKHSHVSDSSKQNKDEVGLLDPWKTNPTDQEDITKSIKFNKPSSQKDETVDNVKSSDNGLDDLLKSNLQASDLLLDPFGEENEKLILLNTSLPEEEKRAKINSIFSRAASNGNVEKVSRMLETAREYIDIDSQDEEGTTPLIYAACFGHDAVAFTLLEAGAKVDAQDRFGWTPLMWATNNNHDKTIRLLLDNGADAGAKSAKGRTVFDFIPPENHKIAEIFIANPQRDSWSSVSSISRWSMLSESEHKLVEQLAEAEMRKRILMESASNLDLDLSSLGFDETDKEEEDDNDQFEFMWNDCLPDQMIVFGVEDIPHIIKTVITGMQPIRNKSQKPVPANVLFLSARFAHYYSSPELLESLLFEVINSIDAVVKSRPDDMTLLSFWISNCTLLLYYLKKDAGLASATVEYQLRISEQLHETYVFLIKDAERRIGKVLESSMLEYDAIPGMDDVRFEGEWRVFRNFRRSRSPQENDYTTPKRSSSISLKRNSSNMIPFRSPASPRQRSAPSPRNITSLLSSTLFILQTYEVHPMIIDQVLNQLFYYISCELFNKILSSKKYLCRSKAMQIRLNVSVIEDWVRTNNLSLSLITHFQPLIQLLQLLMCWSQMNDFAFLVQTTKELNLINPAQLKRVSKNYKYEINEPKITEECQQYILQLEEDTARRNKRYSTESIRSDRSDASSIIYLTVSPTLPPCVEPNWEEEDDLMEMKASDSLLPFAIPTSTEMLANFGTKNKDSDPIIPVVPDEWMEKLDVGMRHGTSGVVEELTSKWEAEYLEDEEDDGVLESMGVSSNI
ncbi:20177_t:CDS:2 [Dentiscutata erythropus]|uniref:20177_t:CDS:1 n=1 Tax=Dentiscutata erythropus TaxID=1348616 RepID=A0A9N9C244_9GLOM|nr:20177_t:CDS:2 [Dentiscutata erythropus]